MNRRFTSPQLFAAIALSAVIAGPLTVARAQTPTPTPAPFVPPSPTIVIAPKTGPDYSAALVTASFNITAPKAGVPGYMVATVRNSNPVDTPLYETYTSPVLTNDASGNPIAVDTTVPPAAGQSWGVQSRTALNVKFTLTIPAAYAPVIPGDAGLRGLMFSPVGVSPQTVTCVVNVLAAQEMKTITIPLVLATDPIALAEKDADAHHMTPTEEAMAANGPAAAAAQAAMQQQFIQAQLQANQNNPNPSPLPPPQPATPAQITGGSSTTP